jgi:hypothetical protein
LTRKTYVLIDESGDLGQGPRASSHFVISASVLEDINSYKRIPKRIRRNHFRPATIGPELKHHKASENVSVRILSAIDRCSVNIYWLAYRKEGGGRSSPGSVYFAICELLIRNVFSKENGMNFVIVLDRFSRSAQIENKFKEMILTEAWLVDIGISLNIQFMDSMSYPSLQVHDFVVGSIFRSLERNDNTHLDIIKDKVVFGKAFTQRDIVKALKEMR